jgi:hypothetical protein
VTNNAQKQKYLGSNANVQLQLELPHLHGHAYSQWDAIEQCGFVCVVTHCIVSLQSVHGSREGVEAFSWEASGCFR